MKTLNELLSDVKELNEEEFITNNPYAFLISKSEEDKRKLLPKDERMNRLRSHTSQLNQTLGPVEFLETSDPRVEIWSDVIVPTYLAGPNFRTTFINPYFQNVYGLYVNEMKGANIDEVFKAIGFSSDDIDAYHQSLNTVGKVNIKCKLSTPERTSFVHLKSTRRTKGGYQGQLEPIAEREYLAASNKRASDSDIFVLSPNYNNGHTDDFGIFYIGSANINPIIIDSPGIRMVHANIKMHKLGGDLHYEFQENQNLGSKLTESTVSINGRKVTVGESINLENGDDINFLDPPVASFKFHTPKSFYRCKKS